MWKRRVELLGMCGMVVVGIVVVLMNAQHGLSALLESAGGDFGPNYETLNSHQNSFAEWEETSISILFSDDAHRSFTSSIAARKTSSDTWQSYPVFGGEMTSIAIGPIITETIGWQIVYVGTRDAGVFKTIDGGQSWVPARSGLTFSPIRTLVSDPQNRRVLYAGTDYDGVWKSMDGGDTWFKSSQGLYEGLIVFSIVVDPQNSDIVYAGLGGGVGLVIGNIYKSQDGGATWTLSDMGIPRSSEGSTYTEAVFTLVIDPTHTDTLYAGTNSDGVFVTTNGGESWAALNEGIPYRPNSTDYLRPVNALAVDPHHSYRPSAIINGEYYIFADDLWQKLSAGSYMNTGIARAFLYFHPIDPLTIYSAGDRFSKSTDGGVTWTQYLGWNDSGHVVEVAFHSTSPDTVYAANDMLMGYWGGVYKSSDQGETWDTASQGITAVPVQSVAIDPQDTRNLYVGTGESHVYRTGDGGASWQIAYLGGSSEISDIAVHPSDSAKIYVAAGDFYTSTDQGGTFHQVDQIEHSTHLAIAPDVAHTIYVGARFGRGIYKSSDGGDTWVQKNEGLPIFGSSICPVLSIAVDPHVPETVWAGLQYGGGIVKSKDGGEHWVVKGLTETNFVEAIAVHPVNSEEILVGAGFNEGQIYKSSDGGATWRVTASDIAFVQDIVYDPRNPRWVYAATEGYGVLRSFSGGESWHTYSDGIFYPLLYSLAVTDEASPLLVVGSYGSGLYWRYPAPPTHVYLPLLLKL